MRIILDTDSGGKGLVLSDLTTEYFITESENGIAVLPMLVSTMGFAIHMVTFAPPAEYSSVEKICFYTDAKKHTIKIETPQTVEEKAFTLSANGEMEAVL